MKDLTNIRHALENTQAELTKKTAALTKQTAELARVHTMVAQLQTELTQSRSSQQMHVCTVGPAVSQWKKSKRKQKNPVEAEADVRATAFSQLILCTLISAAAFFAFVLVVKLSGRS